MSIQAKTAFPPYIELGPERLFHLVPVVGDALRAVGSMKTGPWSTDLHSRPAVGSLGVLVDDVLGFSIAAATPLGKATVTTQIHLDMLRPVPVDGSAVTAEIMSVEFDGSGGFVSGRVSDRSGRVIALATLRGMFVPAVPDRDSTFELCRQTMTSIADPSRMWSAPDAIESRMVTTEEGVDLQFNVSESLVNVRGSQHGGITLCAAEIAGRGALDRHSGADEFVTVAVDIAYLRPAVMGSALTFRARRIHAGREVGLVRVEGFVDEKKPIAVATVMCQRVS